MKNAKACCCYARIQDKLVVSSTQPPIQITKAAKSMMLKKLWFLRTTAVLSSKGMFVLKQSDW
jgi:hypothetical protein